MIELLRRLFPFLVGFDRDGRVTAMGPVLRRVLGRDALEVDSVIALRRPCSSTNFETLQSHAGEVFSASVVGSSMELRGQMELIQQQMLFLGFPWLRSAEQALEFGIELSEFPAHSGIPDMLMLLQSQKMAMTDVERLNERLKRKSATHAGLLAGIPDLILQLDTNGALVQYKLSPSVPLPVAAHAALGKTLSELFIGRSGRRLERLRLDAQRERQALALEFSHGQPPTARDYEVRASPGASGEVLMILRDVTERKAMERELVSAREDALAATRAKSEFLATVSHELRTPMNGVVGLAELLEHTPLNAEQREYLMRLRRSSTSLLDLIDDVLDVSKAEAGKLTLESEDFTVREVVDEVVSIVWERAESRGIELIRATAPDVPLRLRGDAKRLKQVLLNLVSNAVKFTERGSVRIHLSLIGSTPENVELRCEVTDTGIGISEADQRGLFNPFVQADSSTSRRYQGTGLGLNICRRLIELMGGTIGVASTLGQGSCFSFTVCLKHALKPFDALPEEVLTAARMLLVGDSTKTRQLVADYLLVWGIRFETAEFSEAISMLERYRTSTDPIRAVILSGHDMAQASELIAAIRHNVALSSVSLVVVDSHPGAVFEDVQAVVTRPVGQSQLLDGLSEALVPKSREPSKPELCMPFGQLRALVVDDNSTNRVVLAGLLTKHGLTVEQVESGAEAIAMHRRNAYPLIFMDVQMPQMDGYEATALLRETGIPTTVIAVTANALPGDRERCIERGMDLYLAKPLRAAELRRVLAAYGAKSRPSMMPPKAIARNVSSSPPGLSSDTFALDLNRLAELTGDDEALGREFLRGVARDLPLMLRATRDAVTSHEVRTAQRALHPAGGLIRSVSNDAVVRRVTELDQLLRTGAPDPEPAARLLSEVEGDVTRLLADIDAYLSRPPTS